jgi:hypothetical protein
MVWHETVAEDVTGSTELPEFFLEELIVGAGWEGERLVERTITEVVDLIWFEMHDVRSSVEKGLVV